MRNLQLNEQAPLGPVAPYLPDNKLRVLAAASESRSPLAPNVPTLVELGYKDLVVDDWHGLFAPRGTPAAIVADRAALLQAALASPAFVAAMSEMQAVVATPRQATPTALALLLAEETARWAPILRKAGQYAD